MCTTQMLMILGLISAHLSHALPQLLDLARVAGGEYYESKIHSVCTRKREGGV